MNGARAAFRVPRSVITDNVWVSYWISRKVVARIWPRAFPDEGFDK